jgi:hypothetical protein
LLIGIFTTVGLAVVLVVSPVYAQPAFEPGLARAIAVQERHTDSLLETQGVVGTAVGLGAGGSPVVKIYTEARGIPGLPRSLEGIPVVVQVTGKILALHHRPGHGGGPGGGSEDPPAEEPTNPTDRFPRPVPIGVSTGHPDITAGTIGARVTDGANVYALSNNHVYADENQAAIGDNVLQPGPFDGGLNPADAIGTVADFEPIVFSTSANNVIDAAIALSSTADLGNATPSDGYGTPQSTTAAASINQRVRKYGRTTGSTSGRVDAINATVNVGYGTGVARFVNQIVIRPGNFSAGGDSGSLVVARGGSDNGKPVGLLFAGSVAITIANPIDEVLNTLGVTVDGQ